MVASLSIARIDLVWAEDQYWSTLFKVIGEVNKMLTPKEKKPVSAKQMKSFVREE